MSTLNVIENCENCNEKKCVDYIKKYCNKNLCYDCLHKYCYRCFRKLHFSNKEKKQVIKDFGDDFNLTSKCGICSMVLCYNCFVIGCSFCGNAENTDDDSTRCCNCYGSVIILCCGCLCCIDCLMNDVFNNIKYCESHDNYVCEKCHKESLEKKHSIPNDDKQSIIQYILNNGDKCIPELTEFMKHEINNVGYRGPHFM